MRSYQDWCFITVSDGFKVDATRAVRMASICGTELSEPNKRAIIETWLGEFIASGAGAQS